MYYTVYETTNMINGKNYYGRHETDNLNDGYQGSGTALRAAIEEWGEENFVTNILHVFDNPEEMVAKERELIATVLNNGNNYNLRPGDISYTPRGAWVEKDAEEHVEGVSFMYLLGVFLGVFLGLLEMFSPFEGDWSK